MKASFAPVVRERTQLLILGSLPGEISLKRSEYYGNARNQFWRLMSAVTGAPLIELSYQRRLSTLLDFGFGLWDVVGSAERTGSLDTAIRSPVANQLHELFSQLPRLHTVAFNGLKASAIGRRTLGADTGLALITLPSSSPAFTQSFERKLEAWMQLAAAIWPSAAA